MLYFWNICFLFIGIWFKWARLTFLFSSSTAGKEQLMHKRCISYAFLLYCGCTLPLNFWIYLYIYMLFFGHNTRTTEWFCPYTYPFDWTPILVHLVRGIALWNVRNVISYKQIFVAVIQNIHWHELYGIVRLGAHLNLVWVGAAPLLW
jgi:hypothetical protein